jgi:hypothetical protein
MGQAEQEIAQTFKCTQTQTATTSVTATSMYTRPVNALYIDRLTWDQVKLKKIDMTDLDALERTSYGGVYVNGNATHYYEYGDQIGLWPIPSRAAAINFYYIATPATLTSGSTGFTVPTLFHNIIQDYVMYRAVAKDQDDGRSQFYKALWDRGLQAAHTLWRQRESADFYHVVKDEDCYQETELGII